MTCVAFLARTLVPGAAAPGTLPLAAAGTDERSPQTNARRRGGGAKSPTRPAKPYNLKSKWARACANEGGFTLVELLVASALALVLLGGILTVLEMSQQVQARDAEWALTLQEGRVGLARMAREIRQASEVKTHEESTIVFLATIGGTEWEIKYACNVAQTGTEFDECVRYAAKKGEALPTTGPVIVKDVLNGTKVLTYSPSAAPTLASLKLELPAKGTLKQAGSSGYSHHVVLEDAAEIRNLNLSVK